MFVQLDVQKRHHLILFVFLPQPDVQQRHDLILFFTTAGCQDRILLFVPNPAVKTGSCLYSRISRPDLVCTAGCTVMSRPDLVVCTAGCPQQVSVCSSIIAKLDCSQDPPSPLCGSQGVTFQTRWGSLSVGPPPSLFSILHILPV